MICIALYHSDRSALAFVLPLSDVERLLDRIRASFAGTNLVYWTLPMTEFGTID